MSSTKQTPKATVIYISHGGGPLPLLGDAAHAEMLECLKYFATKITKPSAILVISAHWEESKPVITSGALPSLIYDYYGFPEESYEIKYPAPGAPVLAGKISDLLNSAGIAASLDSHRGFDHGLYVPLKIMYPKADIPCLQLSLVNSLNPEEHIKIGKALSGLMSENILVIGSGFSFHNLTAFFSPPTAESQSMNESFERWLNETCSSSDIDEAEREQRLIHWEKAPAARYCHPREEHLLPIHVCYGITRSPATEVLTFEIMGKKASAYLW